MPILTVSGYFYISTGELSGCHGNCMTHKVMLCGTLQKILANSLPVVLKPECALEFPRGLINT
jgi:hypothetical protein